MGSCLPKPPICANGAGGAGGGNAPITCIEKCEYHPPPGVFDPVLKYSWGGQTAPPYGTDVVMTPIVVQLDDDNCDGRVNGLDIPEIVFGAGRLKPGVFDDTSASLVAISIVNGKLVEKWNIPNAIQGYGQIAAGDLDGDGLAEIVGCAPAPAGMDATHSGVIAYRADGSLLWKQTDTSKVHCADEAPAIADPLKNGKPMVLIGLTLLDGKTGDIVKVLDPAADAWEQLPGVSSKVWPHFSSFADVDGDGQLDVLDGRLAFRIDGTLIWDLRSGPDAIAFGYHAIGDLDKDGVPEIAVVSGPAPHRAYVFHYDATQPSKVTFLRKGIDVNAGVTCPAVCSQYGTAEYGGGPPIIADFDGDGFPDVGTATAVAYTVLSGKKLTDPAVPNASTVLWSKPTHDCSSAFTGSSVFDFAGDGHPEVAYSDELRLRIYAGKDGAELFSTCNTTGTLWEYPVVADVDGDDHADIVVVSNATYAEQLKITCDDGGKPTKQSGVRIFSSASGSWVRTRRVWNEHTYHVTNVGDDGSIPKNELPNWTQPGLNDFRQNKQPGNEFAAPDAVVYLLAPDCGAQYGLVATVRNIGEAVLPAGVVVGFYEGTMPSGTKLGTAQTTIPLYPAQAEAVTLALPMPDAALKNGTTPVYAIVDDSATPHPSWHECRTDNNTSAAVSASCQSVN